MARGIDWKLFHELFFLVAKVFIIKEMKELPPTLPLKSVGHRVIPGHLKQGSLCEHRVGAHNIQNYKLETFLLLLLFPSFQPEESILGPSDLGASSCPLTPFHFLITTSHRPNQRPKFF